jgi:hypothetical protein
MEGEGEQVSDITVIISTVITASEIVNIGVMKVGELDVQVRPSSANLTNLGSFDVRLTHVGNTVALEDDTSLRLSLLMDEISDIVIGGPGLFRELDVIISDDAILHVGFTESMLEYERGVVRVNISSAIGRPVVVVIRANDTVSPPDGSPSELVFSPNGPTSILFEFNINIPLDVSRVLLSLEVATYPESLNSFRDRITVGSYPGLYQEVVLVVGEAGTGLSTSATIGISFGLIILVVCVSTAIFMCLAILCYREQAKNGAKTDTPNKEYDEKGIKLSTLPKEEIL